MDQPFINKNTNNNSTNETNSKIENNIYLQENHLQNQEQNNDKNTDQPPEQPYYLSNQNANTLNVKPINSQENQVIPSESISSDNSLLPPAEPYSTSPQDNSPINNNPPPKEILIKKEQSVINIQNQNYNNFSEIRHKGISHPNENTFNISIGCCWKYFPLIIFFMGLILMSYPFTVSKKDSITPFIAGICLFILSLIFFFKLYTHATFIMGKNNLKVERKALCGKKTYIYNPGEILRVLFLYDYSPGDEYEGDSHRYYLWVFPLKGDTVKILSCPFGSPAFTSEEIDYFNYVINSHIQNKMRV